FPRCRGRKCKVLFVEIRRRRLTPRGGSLVRSYLRIALDQLHPVYVNTQLLGHELGLSCKNTLSKVTLARVRRNRTIRRDRQPRVEFVRIDMGRMRCEWPLRLQLDRRQRCRAETHNQRARSLQEVATRPDHAFFASAYFRIASIIRW